MKKRFLFSFLSIFIITGMNVLAQKYEVNFMTVPDKIVIAEYSGDLITSVKVIKTEENQKRVEFETQNPNFSTHLIFSDRIEIITPDKVADKEDKVEENSSNYPAVYNKEKYANRAIMLVTSVSNIYKDNELYVSVGVLFHGKERTLYIDPDVLISNTPEAYGDVSGETAASLKKGDIINVSLLLGKSVDEVYLIFRPTIQNPVLQDTDFGIGFYKLFSTNGMVIGKSDYKVMTPNTGVMNGYGYAFGMILDRNDNELQLCDKNGEVLSVDIADGAIIYEVNTEEKFEASASSLSALRKASGARKSFDEDGKFSGWKMDANYNYAFVRTIDKDATEVVLYKNY